MEILRDRKEDKGKGTYEKIRRKEIRSIKDKKRARESKMRKRERKIEVDRDTEMNRQMGICTEGESKRQRDREYETGRRKKNRGATSP